MVSQYEDFYLRAELMLTRSEKIWDEFKLNQALERVKALESKIINIWKLSRHIETITVHGFSGTNAYDDKVFELVDLIKEYAYELDLSEDEPVTESLSADTTTDAINN
jgi:hypothetical protein